MLFLIPPKPIRRRSSAPELGAVASAIAMGMPPLPQNIPSEPVGGASSMTGENAGQDYRNAMTPGRTMSGPGKSPFGELSGTRRKSDGVPTAAWISKTGELVVIDSATPSNGNGKGDAAASSGSNARRCLARSMSFGQCPSSGSISTGAAGAPGAVASGVRFCGGRRASSSPKRGSRRPAMQAMRAAIAAAATTKAPSAPVASETEASTPHYSVGQSLASTGCARRRSRSADVWLTSSDWPTDSSSSSKSKDKASTRSGRPGAPLPGKRENNHPPLHNGKPVCTKGGRQSLSSRFRRPGTVPGEEGSRAQGGAVSHASHPENTVPVSPGAMRRGLASLALVAQDDADSGFSSEYESDEDAANRVNALERRMRSFGSTASLTDEASFSESASNSPHSGLQDNLLRGPDSPDLEGMVVPLVAPSKYDRSGQEDVFVAPTSERLVQAKTSATVTGVQAGVIRSAPGGSRPAAEGSVSETDTSSSSLAETGELPMGAGPSSTGTTLLPTGTTPLPTGISSMSTGTSQLPTETTLEQSGTDENEGGDAGAEAPQVELTGAGIIVPEMGTEGKILPMARDQVVGGRQMPKMSRRKDAAGEDEEKDGDDNDDDEEEEEDEAMPRILSKPSDLRVPRASCEDELVEAFARARGLAQDVKPMASPETAAELGGLMRQVRESVCVRLASVGESFTYVLLHAENV